MKRLIIVTLAFLCSCKQPAKEQQQVPAPTHQLPTATELFDLQSKCSELGRKILEGNTIGSALTQDQVSHYNPNDNRCYVKLSVTTADLTQPRENYIDDEYLIDGQTGELLASISMKGGKGGAQIYDSSLRKMVKNLDLPSTDEVSDLMDKFVSTDRHP
jgi:hypothetical protein